MRVAIIGGGFFGFHIAQQLEKRYGAIELEIFEQYGSVLGGAGTVNQCRLHMGFHYPRSGYTIYQSIMGFDRFRADYGEFVNEVTSNLYAVHKSGLVTAEEYLAVMDSFHLPYERIAVDRELFRNPSDIDLLLRVPEMSINVKQMREQLGSRVAAKIHANTMIDEVDAAAGKVRSDAVEYGPYDFIINATYTNPNLGFPEEKHFGLKWEIAVMVLARTSLPAAGAVTIMDGEFVSVYPAYDGLHTLSSVAHTPLRRYSEREGFASDYPHRFEIAAREQVGTRIERDVMEHLNFDFEPTELWVTSKTKLGTDMGDSRVTEVRQHERLLSVLCGKLDAVFEASDAILREIR